METPDALQRVKVNFQGNYALAMGNIPCGFKKSYGYLLTMHNGGRQNTIKYELDVTFLDITAQHTRLFQIDRTSKVFINDIEPDLLVDRLAYEAGSVFYPLVIKADPDGRFLSVHNHEQIRQRWDNRRNEILHYFKGEQVDKYCRRMDKTMADSEKINEAIRGDYLITTYFAPVYKAYSPDLAVTETLSFPLIRKAASVVFDVKQRIDEHLNELDGIELWHNGTVADERSADDLKHKRSFAISQTVDEMTLPAEGEYFARYILDDQTKFIRAVNAEWKLNLDHEYIVSVSLYETDPHQVAPATIHANHQSILVMLDKDEPSGLKSFWKSLFKH